VAHPSPRATHIKAWQTALSEGLQALDPLDFGGS